MTENRQMKITDLYDSKVQLGPVDMFVPNSWNTNEMSQEEFEKLKESIKITKGKYLRENPLKVRENSIPDKLEIVDGEHRWKACKELNITKIPFEKSDIDTEKAQKLNVIYSMNRGQVNYFKLSKLLNEFYEKHKITQEQLAERFGLSRSFVADLLLIYPRLKDFLEQLSDVRQLTNAHFHEFSRCQNDYFREKLIDKSIENKWNSKTIRTQATKFNQISDYIDELTKTENEQLSIIESLEDVLFEHPYLFPCLAKNFNQTKILRGK